MTRRSLPSWLTLRSLTGMTGVLRYERGGQQGRSARIAPGGETSLQSIDEHQQWQHRIDLLRDALAALPDLTDQAFIRPSVREALTWTDLDIKQSLHGITEADVRYNKHLLTRYVPDAHGTQVLRAEHLTNASDSRTGGSPASVTVATSSKPKIWRRYARPLPNPRTVIRARADFGAMILTNDTITTNPPPWKP